MAVRRRIDRTPGPCGSDLDLGVMRKRDRRVLGGGIRMGDRPAQRAAVADLENG
jgi:hypothetical protein